MAGLVGLGLSQLWGVSEFERPEIAEQEALSNHMGLFLQKTNIIRDYLEDVLEVALSLSSSSWQPENPSQTHDPLSADGQHHLHPHLFDTRGGY